MSTKRETKHFRNCIKIFRAVLARKIAVCQKASQSSSPAGDEMIKIIFGGGPPCGERSSPDTGGVFLLWKTEHCDRYCDEVREADCNPFAGKARRGFSTVSKLPVPAARAVVISRTDPPGGAGWSWAARRRAAAGKTGSGASGAGPAADRPGPSCFRR